jgi:P2 phage tail completion protein R (GpR)
MYKPASLRAHLTQAVPEFRTDPDKLSILARHGKLIATAAASYSFEYHFTLQLIALDYAGHADAVMLPTLVWLSIHQPELFDNETLREKAIRFEVEYLNHQTVDLMLEIDLSERVIVKPQPGQPAGSYELQHVGEPLRPDDRPTAEHWEFWLHGQKLAEWNYDPTAPGPTAPI